MGAGHVRRGTSVQWILVTAALLAALAASGWLGARSATIVWILWVPVPALIAFIYFDRNHRSRRTACGVIGAVVCLLGVVFVLWGWFLYIPAGLILLLARVWPLGSEGE